MHCYQAYGPLCDNIIIIIIFILSPISNVYKDMSSVDL